MKKKRGEDERRPELIESPSTKIAGASAGSLTSLPLPVAGGRRQDVLSLAVENWYGCDLTCAAAAADLIDVKLKRGGKIGFGRARQDQRRREKKKRPKSEYIFATNSFPIIFTTPSNFMMKRSSDRILSALCLIMSSPSIVTDEMFDYGFA